MTVGDNRLVNSKKQGYFVKTTVLAMDISDHGQLTNIRKDYLHKASTETIKNHDVISVEDLAVKNIMNNWDVNAAKNILTQGITVLSGCAVGHKTKTG